VRSWVFEAHGAHPGDTILVEATGSRKGELHGRIIDIVTPSPDRTSALCRHAGIRTDDPASGCGGCTLQTLGYPAQLELKREFVRRALAGQPSPEVQPTLGMEHPWRYRNKMELTFGNDYDELQLGLHPVGWKFDVFQLRQCELMGEPMLTLVDVSRRILATTGLRAWNPRKGNGTLRTLTIRRAFEPQMWMIELTTSPLEPGQESGLDAWSREVLAQWQHHHPEVPLSMHHSVHDAARGRRTEIRTRHLAGPAELVETLTLPDTRPLRFRIGPRSFFQPNPKQAERLYGLVVDAVQQSGIEQPRVLDLFCGTGTIGLALSSAAREVVGVDLVEQSIDDARSNAASHGVDNTRWIAGDAAAVLESMEDRSFDVVVVDPPRVGLGDAACDLVAGIRPRLLVYVSCNVESMARDLARLRQSMSMTVETLQPVDMFPHTGHIECVARIRVLADAGTP
jgi:23S rRNA (uracil-5-)-methyltransferase RumA